MSNYSLQFRPTLVRTTCVTPQIKKSNDYGPSDPKKKRSLVWVRTLARIRFSKTGNRYPNWTDKPTRSRNRYRGLSLSLRLSKRTNSRPVPRYLSKHTHTHTARLSRFFFRLCSCAHARRVSRQQKRHRHRSLETLETNSSAYSLNESMMV